jgi:hypothetical protein
MTRIPLRCPYCSSVLRVSTRIEGASYLERVPDEIECDSFECAASWRTDGTPLLAARWMEYPNVYRAPAPR